MLKFQIIILVFFIPFYSVGQNIKIITPSNITPLNFSKEGEQEFDEGYKKYIKINDSYSDFESLTEKEKEIVEKYESPESESYWTVVGGGCSFWCCFDGPSEITASSYLSSQGENDYTPENILDDSYKSAWAEGVPGYGIGEYISLLSIKGNFPTSVIIANGYVKSKSAWKNNSRVKKLKVYVDEKPLVIYKLEDSRSEQIFDLPSIEGCGHCDIKFEILDVYKGDKYDDVVISELYFLGPCH